jgi:hypothetical protein
MNAPLPATRGRPWIIALLAAAAGLGFAWLAWQPIGEARHLAASGVRTEARVNTVEEQRRRSGSTFHPVFVFRTPDGRVVRERSAVAVDSPQPYLGRTVTVVYDPANTATVRSLESLQAGAGSTPWIAGALSLLAFAFAGFLMRPLRRPPSGP